MEPFLETLADKLQTSANVRTVFGEPIHALGKVIVPVARVAYGFGGGHGEAKPSNGEAQGERATPESQGGGGGGGVSVVPIGVVEVTAETTRFIPLRGKRLRLLGAFLGGFTACLLLRKEKRIRLIKERMNSAAN
jgi:uncharacterized spore protein YtfJ